MAAGRLADVMLYSADNRGKGQKIGTNSVHFLVLTFCGSNLFEGQ